MRDFIETHLKINDASFKLKPQMAAFVDYVSNNLKTSKPIIVKKARQVGLSTVFRTLELAIALGESKARILHLHPSLLFATSSGIALDNLILDASRGTTRKRNGTLKSVIEERIPWGSMTNTKLFKMFDNENWIRNETVGRDGCRIRGITSDMCVFDEAQAMTVNSVSVVQNILKQAQLGIRGKGLQIYLVTPDKYDFTKEMWDNSSKGQWMYICPHCGHQFELNMSNWETVWISDFDLECTECKSTFDKRSCSGVWVDESTESLYKGFHFNQCQLDILTKENIHKVFEYNFNSPKTITNEVFGEWYKE